MIDAREYLQYFKVAESRIELKIKQIRSLQDRLSSLSAPMDKEQISHTRNVAIMADTIAVIVDMQKEIDQQTSEIFKRKKEAFSLLDHIKPENAEILIDRYFDAKSLPVISQSLHVSKRQTQRRLSEAIQEFQIILNEKTA